MVDQTIKISELTPAVPLEQQAGDKVAAVRGGQTVQVELAGGTGGSSTFLGLSDTPSVFTADKYLRVNSAGDGVEFVDAPTGGGDDAFDWATVGNTTLVPTAKLGSGTADNTKILYGDGSWKDVPTHQDTVGSFPSPTSGRVDRSDAYTTWLIVDTGFDISTGEWMLVKVHFSSDGTLSNQPYAVVNLSELRALGAASSSDLSGTMIFLNDYPHWNDTRIGHTASNTLAVALGAGKNAGDGSIDWAVSVFTVTQGMGSGSGTGDDAYDWATVGNTDTIPDAKIPNLATSKITSGTFGTARLGTGTANSTTFLRGDGTWATPPTGGGGSTTFTGLTDTPSSYGASGTVPTVNATRTGLNFQAGPYDWAKSGNSSRIPVAKLGQSIGTPAGNKYLNDAGVFTTLSLRAITRPEPTLADSSFDNIYGGGAGNNAQDYLTYKRIVANHTVRLSIHNLNEIGHTVSKHGWASQANLVHNNIVGGSVRPTIDDILGIIEYQDSNGDWRIWLFTDGTGEWTDDSRNYDLKYVEIGLGGATETVRLEHDTVTDTGEWRSTDASATTSPRFGNGKQYDIQIRRVGLTTDVVLHAGNELARIADDTEIDSVHTELLALIDDLRHQPPPYDWAKLGNADLIPENKLPPLSADNIVFPDEMGNLRDGTASDWDGTNSLSKIFGWTGHAIQKLGITNVPKSATFTPFLSGNNLGGTDNPRWRGIINFVASVSSPQSGDLVFEKGNTTYRRYNGSQWISLNIGDTILTEAGLFSTTIYADQATALVAVTANGQRAMYVQGGGDGLFTVSDFVAAHSTYPWENAYSIWAQNNDTSIIPASKLGTGATSTNFLRGDGTWATPTGGGTGNDDAFIRISTFEYDSPTREIRIGVEQAGGGTDASKFTLPDFVIRTALHDWALGSNSDRIPLSKMTGGITSSLDTFAFEYQYYQVGELANDMANAATGPLNLVGDPSFDLVVGNLIRVDDEIMEYGDIIGGNTRSLSVSRGALGSTVSAHTAGTAVFAEDRSREFIQLSFGTPDGLTLNASPLEMPFVTKTGLSGRVANWALAGSTTSIPNTKFAGTPDGSKYLLDTGAWSALPTPGTHTEPWALKANPSTRIPVAKMGSGTANSTVFLRGDGAWASASGITQAFADARYAVKASTNTFTAPQTIDTDAGASALVIDQRNKNHGSPGFTVRTGPSGQGHRRILEAFSGTQTDAWFSIEWRSGSSGRPSFGFGDGGGGGRDVTLYREAANHWKTDATFEAAIFDISSGTVNSQTQATRLTATQENLGIETWARVGNTGRLPTSKLGSGASNSSNFLRGDGAWTRPTLLNLSDAPDSFGSAGQVLKVNTATNALVWADEAGGLTQAQVDARVSALVSPWAFLTYTGQIPPIRLGRLGPGQTVPTVGHYLTAFNTGTETIMVWQALPSGGQYPGDDHVKDLIGASGSFLTTHGSIGLDYDTTNRMLEISSDGRTEAQVNEQIEARRDIEWCSATVTATSTAVTIALDGEGDTAAPTTRILAMNYVSTFSNVRPDSLPVFVSYNGLNSGNVQLFGANNARRNMTLGDLRAYGHTNVMHMFRRRSGGWDWVGTSGAASASQDIASLVFDWARIGNTSAIPDAKIPNLNASKTTAGTFSTARIPNLSAGKITSGTFSAARVGTGTTTVGHVLTIQSGGNASWAAPQGGGSGDDAFDWATVGNTDTIPTAKIPNLATSKITTGIMATGRLGSGTADNTTFLRGDGTWATPPSGGGGGGSFPSPTTGTENFTSAYSSWSLIDTGFDISTGEWMLVKAHFGSDGTISNQPFAVINLTELRALGVASSSDLSGTMIYLNDYPHWNDSRVGHSASNTLVLAIGASKASTDSMVWAASIYDESGGGSGSGDDAYDWATVGNTDLIPTEKLGTGTASSSTYLRGDGTWHTPSGGGGISDYDLLSDKPIIRVSNVAAIPTPGSGNVGTRYQTGEGHQYLIERHVLGHVDRVVNYTEFPTVSVGTAGYRGAVYTLYDLPPASLEAENAYFLSQYNALHGGYPWYVRNVDGDWVPTLAFPGSGTYQGGYLDEAQANPHVDAAADVIAYGDGTVREIVLYTVNSDFVAGTGGTTVYEVVPTDRDAGTGGGGDAFSWATQGNTDLVPTAKLGTGTASDSTYLRGDQTWGTLPSSPASGGPGTLRYIPQSALAVIASGVYENRQINITLSGFTDTVNTVIAFHYFHDDVTDSDDDVFISTNGGGRVKVVHLKNDGIFDLDARELIPDAMYVAARRANDWLILAAVQQGTREAWATIGNTDLIPAAKLPGGAATASRFVGANDDGNLRAPTADDWNASHSFSKVLGFDGSQLYRVKREVSAGHGASASYSTVAVDSTFTQGGVTYTYKGSHQHDYNVSASVNDFYFKWSSGYWRVFRARGSRTHDYWENVDLRTIIPTYIGDYSTQTGALAHISAVGQYVVYPISNAYTLRRVTAYTAPTQNVTYDWEHYVPFSIGDITNDVRAIIERNAHTYYEEQTFHVGATDGDRTAWDATREGHDHPWARLDFDVGGSFKAGISLGGGNSEPDVFLYREAADHLYTPDTFQAGVFDVDDSGAETSRENLGVLGRNLDNTLTGTGESGDPLGVSINDITEQVQEFIRHFTTATLSFSSKGATVGHVYNTGPYKTVVSRVTVHVDAPNAGGTYVARIFTLHSDNRIDTHLANSNTRTLSNRRDESFDFDAGSHSIPTNSRILVCISRTDDGNDGNATLQVGSNAGASPEESYDDASIDFDRRGWVEYEHTNPTSGNSTHSHDTDGTADVYGNMRIQYRRTFDHGNYVGDGTVDSSHIDSGSATDGRVLTADGSGGASWEDIDGSGISQSDADARYARLASSNTFEEKQIFHVDSSDGSAIEFTRQGSTHRWGEIKYDLVGTFNAGIAFGGGNSAPDVQLYRESSNHWRTPDTFQVGELRVDSSGRANSRSQLGLGDLATMDAADEVENQRTGTLKLWSGTQSQYDAIGTKDNNTLYYIDSAGVDGGATTFTGLTDTPNSFTGEGGKYLAVNSAANALEFVDGPDAGDDAYDWATEGNNDEIPSSKVTQITNQRTGSLKLWSGTQSQYDAIGTKDNNTIYFVD